MLAGPGKRGIQPWRDVTAGPDTRLGPLELLLLALRSARRGGPIATPQGCTFSAGVGQWNGDETFDMLLSRADQALYRAKDAGRDRIDFAAEPEHATT
jgi:GGDEF domain-containing protein